MGFISIVENCRVVQVFCDTVVIANRREERSGARSDDHHLYPGRYS